MLSYVIVQQAKFRPKAHKCAISSSLLSLLPRHINLPHAQADAAQEGDAEKQPFLIWEDRGAGDANTCGEVALRGRGSC